ncbi:hypothetical protein HPB47_017295 [Ixodes persulcatus]|uniref:Uncharacterized protein n=1 Tax=Ixodes persulcatus TaxID=34615 RepID=A0AC60QNN1_IXOPE|nr:hypothetical protein HPB47_017295 [Ixodes persulcatus]
MAFSTAANAGHHSAIRETWGLDVKLHQDTRMALLLSASNNSKLESSVQSESSVHSDNIRESFMDAYHNVTLHSIMMVRWASTFCRRLDLL